MKARHPALSAGEPLAPEGQRNVAQGAARGRLADRAQALGDGPHCPSSPGGAPESLPIPASAPPGLEKGGRANPGLASAALRASAAAPWATFHCPYGANSLAAFPL